MNPKLKAELIPHPGYAGLRFWTRKPVFRYRMPTFADERDSRLERYRRLARILPVIAVFGTPEEANACVSLLEPEGLEVLVVDAVGAPGTTGCAARARCTHAREVTVPFRVVGRAYRRRSGPGAARRAERLRCGCPHDLF
jgi:hypothetical protein